jgi:Protein of unknown function (DUF2911)
MTKRVIAMSACALAMATIVVAQDDRPASPAATAAAQVGGKYEKQAGIVDPVYTGGKWIEIISGRPIKRGRDLWGSGATYGKMLSLGAPVWRAGANVSTRLKNEVPLVVNGKTIAPGEYSLFIELKDPKSWTFIVSSWPAQTRHDPRNKAALWGAFDYTPDKDVARAAMTVSTLPFAVEQLTWDFVDMTNAGGKIAIMWDKTMATVPFTIVM